MSAAVAYLVLKTVHIAAVTLFFGAGLASVVLKLRADRTGDVPTIRFALRSIVFADALFTIPSGVLLPLTGAAMVALAGHPWRTGWVATGIVLYVVAGLTWLPAWFLQFRMRDAAERAAREGTPLPPDYARWTRIWTVLGVPSFFATVTALWMMVAKGAGG